MSFDDYDDDAYGLMPVMMGGQGGGFLMLEDGGGVPMLHGGQPMLFQGGGGGGGMPMGWGMAGAGGGAGAPCLFDVMGSRYDMSSKSKGQQAKDHKHRLRKCKKRIYGYHQTDPQAADQILKSQEFRAGKKGIAGPACYFAKRHDETEWKAHHKGTLLRATLNMGKVRTYEHGQEDNTLNLDKVLAMGCDSVVLKRTGGVEFVIYDPRQIVSGSIVEVDFATGKPTKGKHHGGGGGGSKKRKKIQGTISGLPPLCPDGGNCTQCNDDKHRRSFRHPCKYGGQCRHCHSDDFPDHTTCFIHPCKYDTGCKRTNPDHHQRFTHGGQLKQPQQQMQNQEDEEDEEDTSSSVGSQPRSAGGNDDFPPNCPSGRNCKDCKDDNHRKSFRHPCKFWDKCRNQDDDEHTKYFVHPCKFGAGCTRSGKQPHATRWQHGRSPAPQGSNSSSNAGSRGPTPPAATGGGLTVCRYDSKPGGCTMKNPEHWKEYSHPKSKKK